MLTNYALENDLFNQIHEAGKEVVVHAIVVGNGRTLRETLGDLDDLATQLPASVTIIVWLNEHFGESAKGRSGLKGWRFTSATERESPASCI